MANVSKFPTSTLSSDFASSITWSNISNITADDGSFASVTLSNGEGSHLGMGGDFNFGISPLATIEGLVISMERYASSSNIISDSEIRLQHPGGSVFSENKSASAYWSTTNGVVTFGSPSDLWGRNSISVDILNNMSFAFRCINDAGYSSATAYVDYVKATVYYSIDGVKFSTSSLSDIKIGSTQIQKIYHGNNQIFPDDDINISWADVVSSTNPITTSTETFTGINTTIPIQLTGGNINGSVSYILNGGSPVSWPAFTSVSITVSNNDTLAFTWSPSKASSASVTLRHMNKFDTSINNYAVIDTISLQKT
jgi:hypothetical protein